MKRLVVFIMFFIYLKTQVWPANVGFSSSEIIFKDGSGWKESNIAICGDDITVLKAVGDVILSNGIKLDSTIGTVRNFIDTSIIGMIMPFASSTLPSGWIPCDGRIIRVSATSNCEYQTLANRIRTTWGPTSNPGSMIGSKFVGRFQLPDLRGQFLRGALTINNANAATSANRESVVLEAANFTRFREPSFSTVVQFTSLDGTLGTYQPSGFTSHSTDHNFTIAAGTTSSDAESHQHISSQITLINNHAFFYPNRLGRYDPRDEDSNEPGYFGNQTSLTQTTSTDANTHTHTFNTSSVAFNNSTNESYPNNAAVTFGIRY